MTQQEFEHIYSSIKADLMRLAGKFCRSASIDLDAEDAVQEALMAFWELAEQGYPMPNPKALLVKITKNICISRYRKRKLETEPITRDNFQGGTSASALVEMADERIIKQRLYDTLTKTERLYMLMRTEQGLSLDEMMQDTYAEITTVELIETIGVLTDNNLDEISSINAKPGRNGIMVTVDFKNGITRTYLMKRGADGSSIELTAQK